MNCKEKDNYEFLDGTVRCNSCSQEWNHDETPEECNPTKSVHHKLRIAIAALESYAEFEKAKTILVDSMCSDKTKFKEHRVDIAQQALERIK